MHIINWCTFYVTVFTVHLLRLLFLFVKARRFLNIHGIFCNVILSSQIYFTIQLIDKTDVLSGQFKIIKSFKMSHQLI